MKISKIMILMSVLYMGSQDLYGWFDLKKDVEKSAHAVGHGLKAAGKGAVQVTKAAGKAVGDVAKSTADMINSIWDASVPMYVDYNSVSGYFLGIQDMAIILVYGSGSQTVHIIKTGQFQPGMSKLFKGLTSGANSSVFSSVLNNQSTSTVSSLHFAMVVNTAGLYIATKNKISQTQSQYGGSSYGGSSYYGSSNGGYQSATSDITNYIGSNTAPLKSLVQPNQYKVMINGSTTSNTPMNRSFYINLN